MEVERQAFGPDYDILPIWSSDVPYSLFNIKVKCREPALRIRFVQPVKLSVGPSPNFKPNGLLKLVADERGNMWRGAEGLHLCHGM